MKIKVYTHPSSERAVKIAVRDRFKKLDEKPQPLPDLSEDSYQAFRDDLASHADYEKLKNDEMENPFLDDRSI